MGSNKDASGKWIRRFANFKSHKKDSKVSFYDINTKSCKEQKVFLSTSPIFESRFCRKIGQNQSVYVSWKYTYFGSNKDAFGIRVRRFANFMCHKKESKVSFYGIKSKP